MAEIEFRVSADDRDGRYWLCWTLLPVLVFGLAGAAVLGASLLRTVPHGSDEVLASGIFFSDSL